MSGGGEQRWQPGRRLRNTAVAIATAATLVITGACGSRAGASPAGKPARPIARAAAEADCRSLAAAACYAPQQFRAAYGILPLLDRPSSTPASTPVGPSSSSATSPSGPSSAPASSPAVPPGGIPEASGGGFSHVRRHLGFVNPAIYRIGRSASYQRTFHDVKTGDNTVAFAHETVTGYHALPGWDPVDRPGEARTRRRWSRCWPATPALEPHRSQPRPTAPPGYAGAELSRNSCWLRPRSPEEQND